MTLKNAINKLKKNGFEVKMRFENSRYYDAFTPSGKDVINFYEQDGEAYGFRIKRVHEEDDIQRDYHAGVYVDNLSQAIRMAI